MTIIEASQLIREANERQIKWQQQLDFVPDFWIEGTHLTKTKCANPPYADHYKHRIAIMKAFHVGSKGDVDENGMSGWIAKRICTGCGKEFLRHKRLFIAD